MKSLKSISFVSIEITALGSRIGKGHPFIFYLKTITFKIKQTLPMCMYLKIKGK